MSIALIKQDRKMRDQIEPETPERLQAAKDVQAVQRADCLARILARFSGIESLDEEAENVRQHFAQWGLVAVRGSALGADQFRLSQLALHAGSQAGAEADASLNHYAALDLAAPQNHAERFHWNTVFTRMHRAWFDCLGGKTTLMTQLLWSARLYPTTEVAHDPRRI